MDFMQTKGPEYLLVLTYLALLVPFWRLLTAGGARRRPAPAGARAPDRPWFAAPDGFHFHRGHTWAREDAGDVVRVGMDDFAHLLLGPVQSLDLPAPGSRISAGERGWAVDVDGERLPVIAPVSGEVVAANESAARAPGVATGDPYGDGWLLKVRVPSARAALKNLMPANLARAWLDGESRVLGGALSGELGAVLQDGGRPVAGLARELAGDAWHELARKALLSD